MAGSGHGDVPVQRGRADRGPRPGPRPPCGARPAGPGAADRHRAPAGRLVGRGAGGATAPGRPGAGAPGRAHRRRRHHQRRPVRDRPVAHHRRKPAGGKRPGRRRLRRHRQCLRVVRLPRHGGGRQYHAGPHHPRGRTGPGRARPDPALHRPLLAHLHAGRGRAGGAGRAGAAAAAGPRLARLRVPRAGAADHRLPLRAGDFHPGQRGQRPDRRRAARHPDQGRRLPGGRTQAALAGAGQDWHADPGQAGADRPGTAARRQRGRAPGAARRGQPGGALGPPRVARAGPGRPRPGRAAGRGERFRRPARPRRAGRDRRRALPAGQPPPDARAGRQHARYRGPHRRL